MSLAWFLFLSLIVFLEMPLIPALVAFVSNLAALRAETKLSATKSSTSFAKLTSGTAFSQTLGWAFLWNMYKNQRSILTDGTFVKALEQKWKGAE